MHACWIEVLFLFFYNVCPKLLNGRKTVEFPKLLSKIVFNIDNMISERSYDIEDCSNDAENSALTTEINYILIYIKNSYFPL